MKFGPVAPSAALGAILAHSVTLPDGVKLRKGIALTAEDVAAMQGAGLGEVTVARLETGDIHEDRAAAQLAAALVPDPAAVGLRVTEAFTGRVNLIAEGPGVSVLDVAALQAMNAIHPMITVATVPDYQQVAAGTMVATIKIISYAVSEADLSRAIAAAPASIAVAASKYKTAGLIVTDINGGPDNTKGITSITHRVEALGMDMVDVQIVPHETAALADGLAALGGDMALILTGSATSDAYDVAPEAVRRCGGAVSRFGMPVDPGNLLFLGAIGNKPVIGLPGCARSPALNGTDWVLSRVACGHVPTSQDIANMGVGGLLKEIPTRPQPRSLRRSATRTRVKAD